MNNVQAAITDFEQADNVINLDERRAIDAIKGVLASTCATLNITPQTLLMAAQHVFNAMCAQMNETDAYLIGVRYAKAHQEPSPDLERSFREYELARAAKRLSDAVRKPLSLAGEMAAVDAAFGPEVA